MHSLTQEQFLTQRVRCCAVRLRKLGRMTYTFKRSGHDSREFHYLLVGTFIATQTRIHYSKGRSSRALRSTPSNSLRRLDNDGS
jgi:hypothetical protein